MKIELTKGKFAIVDEDDFQEINKFKWHCRGGKYGYAVREIRNAGKRELIYMHRVINKTPDSLITDHINGNILDNRKSNLRSVTPNQNMHNQKVRKNTTSKYKGVHWYKPARKWKAQIQVNNKHIYLGQFASEVEAGKAYNEAAKEHFGEYARLNVLESEVYV